jgi:hypothetical protein
MKRNVLWLAGLCVFVLAVGLAARAADEPAKVAGTWELTMEGRQGTITQTLTIEQNGEKIKGTLKGPRAETPFEGTIKGNKISFTIKRETPRGEMTMDYTGTVDGNSIKGTVQTGEFSREWSAKRAEEKQK